MQFMHIKPQILARVILTKPAYFSGALSYYKEQTMSATTAYYQHIIDLYNSRAHSESWDQRLENYRQWLHSQKTFSWPERTGTFE